MNDANEIDTTFFICSLLGGLQCLFDSKIRKGKSSHCGHYPQIHGLMESRREKGGGEGDGKSRKKKKKKSAYDTDGISGEEKCSRDITPCTRIEDGGTLKIEKSLPLTAS